MNSRFCIHQRTAVNLKKRIFQICSFFSVFPLKMIKVSSRIPLSIMSGSYKMLGNLFSTRSKLTSLKDCVVLITGATAGIGEACAWRFADLGSKLVLVGRREERLRVLKNDLLSNYPELDVHTVALSVSDTETVVALPAQLPEKFANVEVLINNAGLGIGVGAADEISVQDARTVLNTNVLGVIAMCRAFIQGMKERGIGHIINMGSISGHEAYSGGAVYCASKFAVEAFTTSARHDLVGTPLRVTHISPGMVSGTEFSNIRFGDDAKAAALYQDMEVLDPHDIADIVIYAATRPRHVQVADIVVYSTNQAGPKNVARVGPTLGDKSLPPN